MASYRAPWYKVEEHERILRHHYERLHRVKPTIRNTYFKRPRALGGVTRRQRQAREAKMWRRHQRMLRNLERAKRPQARLRGRAEKRFAARWVRGRRAVQRDQRRRVFVPAAPRTEARCPSPSASA